MSVLKLLLWLVTHVDLVLLELLLRELDGTVLGLLILSHINQLELSLYLDVLRTGARLEGSGLVGVSAQVLEARGNVGRLRVILLRTANGRGGEGLELLLLMLDASSLTFHEFSILDKRRVRGRVRRQEAAIERTWALFMSCGLLNCCCCCCIC
jgi:hypothetical protein